MKLEVKVSSLQRAANESLVTEITKLTVSQCAPSVFNLDQKFHGVSWFWSLYNYT